jgi:hypothetical protein
VRRARLAAALTACNLALTMTALVATAGGFLLGVRTAAHGRALDVALAAVVWSYIVATPLLAVIALVLGDRRTRLIRASYLLLVVWLIALVATSTMTM